MRRGFWWIVGATMTAALAFGCSDSDSGAGTGGTQSGGGTGPGGTGGSATGGSATGGSAQGGAAPVELKAFPSAFGGGSDATGGRGKALAIINTLDRNAPLTHHPASGSTDEYYEGGLFEAMQHAEVGYIVFNVSGNIELGVGGTGAQFDFAGMPGVNDLTIFGQSAPQGGITLTGGTFRLNGRSGNNQNLIFRYFRSRPIYNRDGVVNTEDDSYTWAFLFYGGNHIMVDHCSAAFAQDKAMGGFIDQSHVPTGDSMTHMTFSNNLLGDSHTGAYVEINPDRPDDPERFVDLISWNRNVIVSMNRTPNLAFEGTAEKINNVLHDIPYKQTSVYHDLRLNEIGNYYSGSAAKNKIRDDIDETGSPLVYTSSNYFEGLLTGAAAEDNIVIWNLFNDTPAPASWFVAQPYAGFPHPTTPTSPQEAFTQLVENGDVGAYQYLDDDGTVQIFRDPFDTSQLEIVRNNQDYTTLNPANYVLPAIPSNTRPASYDTDHDGMADAWEIRELGDLSHSYRGDHDGDGYENIEEYMNQVDG